jgi:formate hydrogenlyase subunit 4
MAVKLYKDIFEEQTSYTTLCCETLLYCGLEDNIFVWQRQSEYSDIVKALCIVIVKMLLFQNVLLLLPKTICRPFRNGKTYQISWRSKTFTLHVVMALYE